ncbi:hypothetical protein PHYPSEUDO_003676 [Phytophthora pseudosyringae]|uniref:N-acetyltransferase domain-containing protein n=1 Tax=Phytophthora pseudosyringae TaxID=221518 RepID=A0A8T1VR57_9STRA|nr:hypothetical protein PHYPSEUDO_003676 [Phytophthora pseudosyringae]
MNEFGQTVGFALEGWSPPPTPPRKSLVGRYCQLEPLTATPHVQEMWDAESEPKGVGWTYMPFGPFASIDEFKQWGVEAEHSPDTQFHAIIVAKQAVGFVAYTHIRPSHGVVEVGAYYSSQLTKTRAATEAMYLAIANAFELGYRRFEWKCDSCNLPSRNAAARFGFTYEGLFRQALVSRGRNRDSTWFSIIDNDWNNGLKEAYGRWLDPSNFDDQGQQKSKLSELTAPFVHARS